MTDSILKVPKFIKKYTIIIFNVLKFIPTYLRVNLKAIFSKKKKIIIFLNHPAQYQNLYSIPELLAKDFFILIFCHNMETYNNIPELPNIKKIQYEHLYVLKLFRCQLFMTPVFGLKNFLPNTPKVNFLHSLAGVEGIYKENAFDNFDYIFCPSPYLVEDFKKLFSKRKVGKKVLISGGYPKLDMQLARAQKEKITRGNKKTVIYAPTFVFEHNKGLSTLEEYGEKIIDYFIDENYQVIFRPHPFALKTKNKFIVQPIIDKFKDHPSFELDQSKDYFDTYNRADFLVTDLSGTGFSFAFIFEKPVLFFSMGKKALANLTGFHFEKREEIGFVVEDMAGLKIKSKEIYNTYDTLAAKIANLKEENIFNLGKSAQYFQENIHHIIKEEKHKDWVSIN